MFINQTANYGNSFCSHEQTQFPTGLPDDGRSSSRLPPTTIAARSISVLQNVLSAVCYAVRKNDNTSFDEKAEKKKTCTCVVLDFEVNACGETSGFKETKSHARLGIRRQFAITSRQSWTTWPPHAASDLPSDDALTEPTRHRSTDPEFSRSGEDRVYYARSVQ